MKIVKRNIDWEFISSFEQGNMKVRELVRRFKVKSLWDIFDYQGDSTRPEAEYNRKIWNNFKEEGAKVYINME